MHLRDAVGSEITHLELIDTVLVKMKSTRMETLSERIVQSRVDFAVLEVFSDRFFCE